MRTTPYAESTSSEEIWASWDIEWSAVWVGALTALAAAVVLGLVGTAIGATAIKPFTSWHTVSLIDLVIAICAAFFSFVAGGWVAGKVSGFRHSEPAILHAAVSWLVALPLMLVLVSTGGGSAFNSWYGSGAPALGGATAAAALSPEATRGTALATLTVILIGLIGSVVGGWIASGEPMNLTHHRGREPRMFLS